MSGAALDKLTTLKDWIASLDAWQDWVGSTDLATCKARITWPFFDAPSTYPNLVLELMKTQWRNLAATSTGSSFQLTGTIKLGLWDVDATPDDIPGSFTVFGDHFFELMDEIATNAHDGPILFNEIATDEVPYVYCQENKKRTDDRYYWHGNLYIPWGVS